MNQFNKTTNRILLKQKALEAVKTLIEFIGDDPNRPGLVDTPSRVVKAWEQDWGLGYNEDFLEKQVHSILNGQFEDGAEQASQLIAVKDIKFTSHCEHHLAEFSGVAHVAYIPGGEKKVILGLSKLVRIVDMYSKKLQVQERLTNQIADFLQDNCAPLGVGVMLKATHSCMCSRGVKQYQTVAVTSALRGEMLTDPAVRQEFLDLVR